MVVDNSNARIFFNFFISLLMVALVIAVKEQFKLINEPVRPPP
jgi:hypothetical protein